MKKLDIAIYAASLDDGCPSSPQEGLEIQSRRVQEAGRGCRYSAKWCAERGIPYTVSYTHVDTFSLLMQVDSFCAEMDPSLKINRITARTLGSELVNRPEIDAAACAQALESLLVWAL